jgi:hypothetical protein
MASGGMIYMTSFMRIGFGVQNLLGLKLKEGKAIPVRDLEGR